MNTHSFDIAGECSWWVVMAWAPGDESYVAD